MSYQETLLILQFFHSDGVFGLNIPTLYNLFMGKLIWILNFYGPLTLWSSNSSQPVFFLGQQLAGLSILKTLKKLEQV